MKTLSINNKYIFNSNNEIHKYTTRFHNNFYVPPVNATKAEKGIYIPHIKVFNHLPQSIKNLANDEVSFKSVLKRFLCHHPFYSIEEYFQYRKVK
jgi:hypothetical protein